MSYAPVAQTMDSFHTPLWGMVTYLKIYTPDYKRLSWLQVWETFAEVYPNRWAMEFFPPATEMINEAHVYHLWMLPEGWIQPERMNLAVKYRN